MTESPAAAGFLNELADLAAKYKAAGTTPNTNYGHGTGGLFSNPALERDIYSAIIAAPYSGLQYYLPVRGTNITDPLDSIITGVTDTSGSEPTNICDDPPTSGLVKLCEHTYVLGRMSRQTPVYDISRGTRLANRGEHTDFQIFGAPNHVGGGPGMFAPTLGIDMGAAANTEVGKIMLAYTVAWARDFARKIYTGNPATGNTAGGGYKEFYGLDILINTGYRDAVTGTACPAADSIIRSFGNVNVTTSPTNIVAAVTSTYFELLTKAATTNLMPVDWVLAMPLSLFYEITRVWPCSYLTDGCVLSGNNTNFVNSGDQIKMRDEMRGDLATRSGQFLWVMGRKLPVILDDSITETRVGGDIFSAPIYFVPLTVLGGQPVTFIEYLNYNSIGVDKGIAAFSPQGFFRITDNGRFLMAMKAPSNWCVQILGLTEPRIKVQTPYLAARITGVGYSHLPNVPSGFPDQTSYYRDGGSVNYTGYPWGPSFFTPTS